MTPPLSLAAAAAAVAAVWLSGAALGGLAGLREGRLRDLALDLALGLVLLAFAGSVILVAGGTLRLPVMAAILAAPVAAALATRRLRPGFRAAPPLAGGRLTRGILAAAGVVVLVVLTAALRERLTWDAWAFWSLKGTMLFHDGALPPDLFHDPGPYDYAHADYPLGLPLLYWWVFRFAGEAAPGLGSFVGALWFALLPVLFWDSARDHARPALAALGALGVAAFWPIGLYAAGGQADVFVALAALGITVHLAEAAAADGDPGALWRAASFAALAAMTKNEGLALAAIAAAATLAWLLARRRASLRRLAALALPLALALPWTLWVRARGLEAEHLGGGVGAGEVTGRLLLIGRALLGLALHRSWVPVAPLAAAAAAFALRAPPGGLRLRLRLPLAIIGVYVAALMAIYLRAPRDLQWLLDTSLERVMTGIVPAVVLIAVVGAATPDGTSRGGARVRVWAADPRPSCGDAVEPAFSPRRKD